MLDLEHPDITSALRTGYPRNHRETHYYCEECGRELTGESKYEDEHHDYLCSDCLLSFHKKGW